MSSCMSVGGVWGAPRAPDALQRAQEAGDVLRIFLTKSRSVTGGKKRKETKPNKGNRSPVGSHENLCLALRNSRKIVGKTKVVFCDGG